MCAFILLKNDVEFQGYYENRKELVDYKQC